MQANFQMYNPSFLKIAIFGTTEMYEARIIGTFLIPFKSKTTRLEITSFKMTRSFYLSQTNDNFYTGFYTMLLEAMNNQ